MGISTTARMSASSCSEDCSDSDLRHCGEGRTKPGQLIRPRTPVSTRHKRCNRVVHGTYDEQWSMRRLSATQLTCAFMNLECAPSCLAESASDRFSDSTYTLWEPVVKPTRCHHGGTLLRVVAQYRACART